MEPFNPNKFLAEFAQTPEQQFINAMDQCLNATAHTLKLCASRDGKTMIGGYKIRLIDAKSIDAFRSGINSKQIEDTDKKKMLVNFYLDALEKGQAILEIKKGKGSYEGLTTVENKGKIPVKKDGTVRPYRKLHTCDRNDLAQVTKAVRQKLNFIPISPTTEETSPGETAVKEEKKHEAHEKTEKKEVHTETRSPVEQAMRSEDQQRHTNLAKAAKESLEIGSQTRKAQTQARSENFEKQIEKDHKLHDEKRKEQEKEDEKLSMMLSDEIKKEEIKKDTE